METADELIGTYRMMVLIRRFEERMEQVFLEGVISGTCHPCIGQEAVAVGAAAAVRPGDYMVSNHRGHGHFLARGGDAKRILAEVFGKETGYSKGRGGSQHMASFADGFLGSNGITGGGIPIATGAALALQLQKRDQIVISFLGDGATNQGAFHEAVNMGAVWKLPIIYLCENNLYAMSTRFDEAFAIQDIIERAPGYGIPGEMVDGNDVLAVKKAVAKAAERARSGGGPTLVECKTYRFCGHSRGDPREYRSREEEAEWHEKCPIKRLRETLVEMGALDDAMDERIISEVEKEIADAEEFARNSPPPPLDSLEEGVFA